MGRKQSWHQGKPITYDDDDKIDDNDNEDDNYDDDDDYNNNGNGVFFLPKHFVFKNYESKGHSS